MNSVALVGRLTRDPNVRYSQSGMAVARFTLAVDRPKKDGVSSADFPAIVCFGKTAEMAEKYLYKGRLIAVTGRITTGSYTDKDGKKVYTTEVAADRFDFLDFKEEKEEQMESPIAGFSQLEGDIPF